MSNYIFSHYVCHEYEKYLHNLKAKDRHYRHFFDDIEIQELNQLRMNYGWLLDKPFTEQLKIATSIELFCKYKPKRKKK